MQALKFKKTRPKMYQKPFERKKRISILTGKEYIDLCADVERAEEILKGIEEECDALEKKKNESKVFFDEARNNLSDIATKKAILEAEGNEVCEELSEQYRQAKISFVDAKRRFEILENEKVQGKEKAKQKLDLVQDTLKSFLCGCEADLISEKNELETELKEAWKHYGFVENTIKSIKKDLYNVKKALSIICGNNNHEYESFLDGDYEVFRCKRCGHEYSNHLPPLWKD